MLGINIFPFNASLLINLCFLTELINPCYFIDVHPFPAHDFQYKFYLSSHQLQDYLVSLRLPKLESESPNADGYNYGNYCLLEPN